MRALLLASVLAAPAAADTLRLYADDPVECGTFAEGVLSDEDFFPGGEAESLVLVDPVRVSENPDAMLYEGAATSEGQAFRIGPVVVVREFGLDGVEVVRVFTASEPMQERRVCPD